MSLLPCIMACFKLVFSCSPDWICAHPASNRAPSQLPSSLQSLLQVPACLHDTSTHFLQVQPSVLGVDLGFKVPDSDFLHLKIFKIPNPFSFYLWVGLLWPSISQVLTANITWSFWILQDQFPDLGLCYCCKNNTASKMNHLSEWECLIDSSRFIQHKRLKASSQDPAVKCHSSSCHVKPKEQTLCMF